VGVCVPTGITKSSRSRPAVLVLSYWEFCLALGSAPTPTSANRHSTTTDHTYRRAESGLQTANRSVPRTCSTSARAPAPSRVTRDALYARGVGAPYPPLSSPLCAGRPLWPGLTLKQGALADCPVWGQRPNHQVPPSGTRLSGRFGCAARIGHCGLPEGGQGLMCTVSAKVTSCTLCMAPRLSLSLRSIDRRCDL
jgi:hypothetical protein